MQRSGCLILDAGLATMDMGFVTASANAAFRGMEVGNVTYVDGVSVNRDERADLDKNEHGLHIHDGQELHSPPRPGGGEKRLTINRHNEYVMSDITQGAHTCVGLYSHGSLGRVTFFADFCRGHSLLNDLFDVLCFGPYLCHSPCVCHMVGPHRYLVVDAMGCTICPRVVVGRRSGMVASVCGHPSYHDRLEGVVGRPSVACVREIRDAAVG